MHGPEAPIVEDALASDETQQGSILLRRVIPLTALTLIAALVGLIVYSVVRPADAQNSSGFAINESGALVRLEPRPAADFTLALFPDDESVRLSNFRGQLVVVNFWASWCPPCREEARDLEQAWRELQDEKVVFLGLNVWDDRDDALDFIDEFDVSYRNGVTEVRRVTVDFGVRGIPETFILNEDGLIVAKFVGPVEVGQLIETVRQVKTMP